MANIPDGDRRAAAKAPTDDCPNYPQGAVSSCSKRRPLGSAYKPLDCVWEAVSGDLPSVHVYKISCGGAARCLNLSLKNTDFMGLHIAVAGNIGAGKTTLVTKLAKHYGWEAHFEAVDENPYLSDFYQDMSKWSFPLQIYFLHSRFNQVRSIRESGHTIIQDRTIYEDAYIFARNLRDSDFLSKRDFENYFSLFQSMTSVIQPPDLLIYLRASIPKLTEQISKRGRDYEASISIGYLEDLNRHYETWISDYKDGKLLIVDVNNTDFVRNPEDLHEVVKRIDADLHGLFSDPDYKRASMFTTPEIL